MSEGIQTYCEAAEESLRLWRISMVASDAYRVIVEYGQMRLLRLSPKTRCLPRGLIISAVSELPPVIDRLLLEAHDLLRRNSLNMIDEDEFTDLAENTLFKLHDFTVAWSFVLHHYDRLAPAVQDEVMYHYATTLNDYPKLIEMLENDHSVPLLAAGSRAVDLLRSQLPDRSIALTWCYLRPCSIVDDAVATRYDV